LVETIDYVITLNLCLGLSPGDSSQKTDTHMSNIKNKLALVLAGLCVVASNAQAAVDAALSAPVTDLSAYWTTIQTLLLAVTVFLIGLAYLKKVRSR